MRKNLHRKAANSMGVVRVPAIVLVALLSSAQAPAPSGQAPDITLPPGDAARGKAIFESSKANCLSCHRVNGTGSLYGPDLSAVGAPPRGGGQGRGGGGGGGNARGAATPPAGPTAQQMTQSILDPNAVVAVQNRYVRLT